MSSLEKLSEQIKEAEVEMYKSMGAYRPRKDVNPEYPDARDRDVQMKFKAAELIAEYEHLIRLWEVRNEIKEK